MKISATPVYNNKTLQSVDLKFEHDEEIKEINLPTVGDFHNCSIKQCNPSHLSLWYKGNENGGTLFTGDNGSTEFIKLTNEGLKTDSYYASKGENIDTKGEKMPVYAYHQTYHNVFYLAVKDGSIWGKKIHDAHIKGKIE